ncbi:MAG TPA: nucleotidyltransferase family protein, partial [Polyangiaceae bacterium]|nr:nucleotidyltransferase family protein [Polyangiaceae bacterium]
HSPMAPNIDIVAAKLESLTERLRNEFDVAALHVFGSVARNEARADSDLDVLVDFAGAPTFARFMDLKFLLEDELQMRVDLVTRNALRPPVKARILAEARRVA